MKVLSERRIIYSAVASMKTQMRPYIGLQDMGLPVQHCPCGPRYHARPRLFPSVPKVCTTPAKTSTGDAACVSPLLRKKIKLKPTVSHHLMNSPYTQHWLKPRSENREPWVVRIVGDNVSGSPRMQNKCCDFDYISAYFLALICTELTTVFPPLFN